jgi:hypothetical protein
MPYYKEGRIHPGDPYFGTRWATDEEMDVAKIALMDLQIHRNSIILVPAPNKSFAGHKIRVQESQNPKWYRNFGLAYWRGRRSLLLKRRRVVKALERVYVKGLVRRNGYETRLLPVLLKEFTSTLCQSQRP